jgi:hypothetical protein
MAAIGYLFGLVSFFGFIGMIYPTPLHKKLKLTKRWMSLIVWLVAAAIANPFLPKDKQEAAKPKPATPTVQVAAKKEEAPKPALAPKPAPKPAPSTQDPEIQDYVNQMSKNSERMTTDWNELTSLFSNPTMDDDWKLKCATALADMQLNIEEAHKIKPPKIFEHVHETYLKGMDQYNIVVQKLPKAIDDRDPNAITALAANIDQGAQYINQATQELKDMIQNHKIQASN